MENSYLSTLPEELRYDKGTSKFAKFLGEELKISPIKIDYLLTGYFGRFIGFFTGKPGVYNPLKTIERESYFNSGRKISRFYDEMEKNDAQYKALKNNMKTYTPEEKTRIINNNTQFKNILLELESYNKVDLEKSPQIGKFYQQKIIQSIDKLDY